MSFEDYKPIINNSDLCIRPQQSSEFVFNGDEYLAATRLFIAGETNISPYWKTEPDYQMLYRRIDDSLRSDVAFHDRFCLDFSTQRCSYPKIAFKKIVAPFKTPMFVLNDCADEWCFGVRAKARELRIYGYLRVCIEVRLASEAFEKHSTVSEPDAVYTIDIAEGSYDWKDFLSFAVIDSSRVANVCYFVEGEDYEGEIFFEAPRFESTNGHNLLGQFLPHTEDRKTVNWMGQNLSKIEWIGLRVDINHKTVFDGEIFERCHRFSEAEIEIPKGIIQPGQNSLTLTCTSRYRDAAGYVLHEFGFITEKSTQIVSVPQSIVVGKPFYVCLEGTKGEKIDLRSDKIIACGDFTFHRDGLNAFCFICDQPTNNLSFYLNDQEVRISRCVERGDDGVITGTGDMVYVTVEEDSVKNYLKWYLSQHVGNMLTIRPTYRWNGTRIVNSKLYKELAAFLDSMDIRYSHMLDGRELPGCNANPTESELNTPHFLGRQTHEFDGQFVYWGYRDVTDDLSAQMFYDLFLRMNRVYAERMHGRYIPENVYYTPKKQYIFRSPIEPSDMQQAAERFVASLRNTRKGVLRHTGPSTLFKYFYQAGYKWLGAELMYSPTELTIAALRGASDVYGGKIGAHLAVQWSTSPHDTVSRYRRYRLALFICYIQGIDEINTEEGLWRLEEYYSFHHRFSTACQNHTEQQQDLLKYISTHTRRGRFYTPIAFLSGRYDGWKCFGRNNTWGVNSFGFGDPERAWDLLTYFYPKSVQDSLYRHNCPDEEIGYYSGTPVGNVDIIPIEAKDFSKYRLLIACGYNKAEDVDLEKLKKYVIEGGKLIIGWPELSVTTDRKKVLAYDHTYFDKKERSFIRDTYRSLPLSVSEEITYDRVLLYTDSGRPLVTLKKMGSGTLCFVNAKEYAGIPAVDLAYREAIAYFTADCLADEHVYARGDRNVQFTVYEKESGERDIYFIATDWHKSNPDGVGTLIIGSNEYSISVPWGQLIKVSVHGDCAIYPEKDENEVISFDDSSVRLQGEGLATFVFCKNGICKKFTVDFSIKSVQELTVKELEKNFS